MIEKLIPLLIRWLLPVLIVIGLVAAFYQWAHGHGVAAQKAKDYPVIAQLTKELESERATVRAAALTAELQREAQHNAEQALAAEHVQLISKLKAEHAATVKRLTQRKEELNESVPHLVSPAADTRCLVPAGFVRLHNAAALPDPDPAGPAQAAAVSPGDTGDADAPSGVALSAVGRTVADNYLTCQGVRQQVLQWQSWYREAFDAWLRAVQQQGSFSVVAPAAALPPATAVPAKP